MTRAPTRQRCGYCMTARDDEGHQRCPRGGPATSGGMAWTCGCDHPSHQEGS